MYKNFVSGNSLPENVSNSDDTTSSEFETFSVSEKVFLMIHHQFAYNLGCRSLLLFFCQYLSFEHGTDPTSN